MVYEPIARSEIPDLAVLAIALLTRCVLISPTSRRDAANTLCQALQPESPAS